MKDHHAVQMPYLRALSDYQVCIALVYWSREANRYEHHATLCWESNASLEYRARRAMRPEIAETLEELRRLDNGALALRWRRLPPVEGAA